MEEASCSPVLDGELIGIKFGLATHQEIDSQSFRAPELFNSANTFDSVEGEAETSLIRAVYLDSKSELAARMKRLGGELDRATASKLLQLCCKLDSAECASAILAGELGAIPPVNKLDDVSGKSPLHTAASAHAWRCVEVLLKKHARIDLRTKDGEGQLALELSLTDTRINPNRDLNTKDLVNHLREKVKTISRIFTNCGIFKSKNEEIGDVAYSLAVKGRVASLTALLIVAAEKVNGSVLESRLTIYECLIRKALALGRRTTAATEGENSERRKLLLQGIELLQLFGVVSQTRGGGFKKVPSLLIRAAQVGDEDIIQLLLNTNIDVNDADAQGNTALHWLLELSQLSCPQQIRILHLLLQHDAIPCQRNKLGMTPFHVAARNGNSEALEVLLLEDPAGVQYKTEMKETPLFFAVMNEGKECAELLLTWGADGEVLNLCKQRAIDLETSQDMHNILLNPTKVSLINHASPNQNKCTTSELTDEDTTTTTERNVKWLYAHCEEESQKVKEGVNQSNSCATKLLKNKVFVGGLHPSVNADDLRKFCEEEFGSVEDATVIVTQIENKIQSRGFGFVTFRQEKSTSEAVQAQNATMRGKTVEIKGLIPVLGAELEKMSPQREQEQNFQRLQQKSNESIKEGDNPEQGYWADRLVHQQPTVCSTEPQVTKSSPTWLKVFKKWFTGFLKGLSNHPTYPLSSLKEDFHAKFALEIDHSSLGFTKLSDFLKDFSNLCTVEMLPMRKYRSTTHMILRPIISSPPCRHLQDLRGTTCISWVLTDCVILAGDSRGSNSKNELVSDTQSKFREMTPCILTAHAGSLSFEASQTCTYMKRNMSEEILNGTDINSVQNLGKLSEARDFKDKKVTVEILIGGIQDKVPMCCYFFHKMGLVGSYVVDWRVIGSGTAIVDNILAAMWLKYGGNTPCSVMVDIIGYILLIAALRDKRTGGLISVRTVREAGISIDICLTVVEMIAKFYDTRLSLAEIDDQNKIELPLSFKESEDKMVFLVYQRGLSAEVERWLQDDVESIKEGGKGHMLTELEGKYYAHRVEMISRVAQEKCLTTAMTITEDKRKLPTPFTIRRTLFGYYELEKDERKYPVFVAGQSLAMVKSLCISTDMENRRLVD